MGLAEAYENYKDNGGEIAITGFNFQAYTGIYYMIQLYKKSKEFEIFFEDEDDIVLKNITDNRYYKIQVKSEKLTLSKIIKEDKNNRNILGKLLCNKKYTNYTISFPSESGNQLKKVSKPQEYCIGKKCYLFDRSYQEKDAKGKVKVNKEFEKIKEIMNEEDYKNKNLIFHEMPFVKDSSACFHYLYGFAIDEVFEDGKKIEMNQKELASLIGSIYNISTKSFYKKSLTDKTFKDMEKISEDEKILNEFLDILGIEKSPLYKRKMLEFKGEYLLNKDYYEEKFSKIDFIEYNYEEKFILNYEKNIINIFNSLDENSKRIIDKYLIGWYIIFRILERENNYEN